MLAYSCLAISCQVVKNHLPSSFMLWMETPKDLTLPQRVFTWLCFNVDIYTTRLPSGIKVLKSWLIISLVQSYINVGQLVLVTSCWQSLIMEEIKQWWWDVEIFKNNNYMSCKSFINFIWVTLTLCCVIVCKIQLPTD